MQLLECTIREANYVVDFHWAEHEVNDIVRELAHAGFKYIEIGHGLGLGAYRTQAPDLYEDHTYTISAVENKGNALIGAFFIPGIGSKDDIRSFRKDGGEFIRIGTNVSQSERALEYIEYAKSIDLEVSFNFMKSYAASPASLSRRAKDVAHAGVDIIYIVDSAGGMVPGQVKRYIEALKDTVDTRIGFHGHNNLLLANANNLAAVESGASIVDTTLVGIGRSGGNAPTASMLVALHRSGYSTSIDPLRVANIGERLVRSRSEGWKESNERELISGCAMLHSSFLECIDKYVVKCGVDFSDLVIAVANIDKENPSEELVRTEAIKLSGMRGC